jgi:hypothetical protein
MSVGTTRSQAAASRKHYLTVRVSASARSLGAAKIAAKTRVVNCTVITSYAVGRIEAARSCMPTNRNAGACASGRTVELPVRAQFALLLSRAVARSHVASTVHHRRWTGSASASANRGILARTARQSHRAKEMVAKGVKTPHTRCVEERSVGGQLSSRTRMAASAVSVIAIQAGRGRGVMIQTAPKRATQQSVVGKSVAGPCLKSVADASASRSANANARQGGRALLVISRSCQRQEGRKRLCPVLMARRSSREETQSCAPRGV